MANVLFPGAPTLLLLAALAVWLVDPKNAVSINGSADGAVANGRWSGLGFDLCLGGAAAPGGWTLAIPYWFIAAVAGMPLATQVCRRAHRSWRADCVSQL